LSAIIYLVCVISDESTSCLLFLLKQAIITDFAVFVETGYHYDFAVFVETGYHYRFCKRKIEYKRRVIH
jgi:hypothetical protein